MKYFFVKLAVFVSVLILLQELITHFVPYRPPATINDLAADIQKKTDVIYFGDSTTTYYSIHEADQRSTQEILGSLLHKYTVGSLHHDSYQAGMYDAYTQYMVKQQFHPSYIIIPVNLRSFSISWDLAPGSQFT